MEISDRLKKIRLHYNLSQKDTAQRLNVVYQTYQKWETGVRIPTVKSLELFSEAFDVSMGYLVGETNIITSHHILNKLEQLPAEGQKRVFDYTDSLLKKLD